MAKAQLPRNSGRTEYLLLVQSSVEVPLQQPFPKAASAMGKVLVLKGADVGLD